MDATIEEEREGSVGQVPEDTTVPNRRALAASAVASIQRFKQSWISVMVLKSGIGLGQVITLFVLLILASILPSPAHPSQPQSTPSDQCAHPQLFQAWMGANIFRLLTCWSASCWMLVRRERARRAEERLDEEVEIGNRDRRRVQQEQQQQRRQARQSERDRRRQRRREQEERDQDPSQTSSTASSIPTLTNSASTWSTSSLALSSPPSQRNETPASVYHPTFATSNASLDRMALVFAESNKSTSHLPPSISIPHLTTPSIPEHIGVIPLSSPNSVSGCSMSGLTPISTPLPSPYPRELGPDPLATPSLTMSPSPYSRSSTHIASSTDVCHVDVNQRTLQHARDMVHDAAGEAPEVISSRARFAAWLDWLTPYISTSMGALSLILFVLGHFLLFMPVATSPNSCYHGAPLLWWGVMAVVGVGWALVLNMFVVVVVVYIGGTVVIALLRRLGIVDTPPEPEPPRPPQPEPLTPAELATIGIVCYLPDPTEPCSSPSSPSSSSPSLPISYDPSRLPVPGITLKADHTTCAICQETFTPPQSAPKRIMYDVEKLRQLGCGHVYHVDCIDHWLLRGSGNCPFCNGAVRDMVASGEKNAAGTRSNRTSVDETPRPRRFRLALLG